MSTTLVLRPDLTHWHVLNAAQRVALGYVESGSRSAASFAQDALLELTGKRVWTKEAGSLAETQRHGYATVLPLLDTARRVMSGLSADDRGHSLRLSLDKLQQIARGKLP